jgi:hypothetical protein
MKRRHHHQEDDDAILKIPIVQERFESFVTFRYKSHTIEIHKPEDGQKSSLLLLWSSNDLRLKIIGEESEKSLLELAVYWIDRNIEAKAKKKKT